MKRQRGRGRKPGGGGGGNQGNRPLESNGPDVKIRGTAAQIYDKYMQYARDSHSSGDRVRYENYLQHAEHYYRMMAATMPRERLLQQSLDAGFGGQPGQGEERDEDTAADPMKVVDEADDDAPGAENGAIEAREEDDDEEDGFSASEGEAEGDDRGDGSGRGRRRRGRRRRPDGGGDRPQGGGDTEARSALDTLAARQGAYAGG